MAQNFDSKTHTSQKQSSIKKKRAVNGQSTNFRYI